MKKFIYQVKNKEGRTIKGIIEATNEKQAVEILHQRNLVVVSLRPQTKNWFSRLRSLLSRVRSSDKINFTRQLAIMMTAGLPLTEALSILEAQSNPSFAVVVADILNEVEAGKSLAEALAKHPAVFDQVYIALVRAGETAGVLDKVLLRLADNLEKQREFSSRVKGAMIYPAMVVGGMLLVAVVMIVFVIPKMMTLFEEFQAELPLPTRILLALSRLVTHYWWLGALALGGMILGWRVLIQKPCFQKQLDRFLFKVPILGRLRQQMMLTEFTRTLGLLIGAGVLMVEAIAIVRRVLKSSLYEEAIKKASEEVERGLPLATTLAKSGLFPPLLLQMVAVGEETGKMDEVLAKVSSYFEQEADAAVRGLTAALEPLIMIVLGVGVGFLVVSIIMPIYNLTSQF